MDFDYGKLRERIGEVFGTLEAFSAKSGLKCGELNMKLQNKTEFTQREINRCCALLSIGSRDIPAYFFSAKSSENRTLVPDGDFSAELKKKPRKTGDPKWPVRRARQTGAPSSDSQPYIIHRVQKEEDDR